MGMNKMFKKVLAVVAAGAMTMGMAMPTFAADAGKTTEAWITKTYNTESGKAEKFSFTAEQVKTGTGIITTDAAVTMPEISFTDTETGTTSDAQFDFTATFKFPTGTDANTLGGIKDANGKPVSLDGNGTCSFKLKATESMKFTGVPVGTIITVKESAAKNYKGSAEITINGAKLTPVAATAYNTELTAVTNQKLGQKQNTVDVTNTYNDVPVTGIIMNTLPYVLMIALCGVALIAFVGFKRRRLQK